jgi:hypothetical protein
MALIGVKNTRLSLRSQSCLQGGEDKLAIMVFPNLMGNNLLGSNIFNACQIPDASSIHDTTQIAAPNLIGLTDFI